VLYVFCGLVPYLGFMEALTTGAMSIKQNIHLVKNVMLPIELIPVRAVLVGMASQFVSMAFVLILVTVNNSLSWHVLWLPAVVVLQMMWLVGLVWILSSITVALPDVTYFVNLFVFMLMFLSPIGYRPDAVPASFRWVIRFQPDLLPDRDVSRQHALRPLAAVVGARRLRRHVFGDICGGQRLLRALQGRADGLRVTDDSKPVRPALHAAVVLLGVLLAAYVAATVFVHPIADDFDSASNARQSGYATAWRQQYLTWNEKRLRAGARRSAEHAVTHGVSRGVALMAVAFVAALYAFLSALAAERWPPDAGRDADARGVVPVADARPRPGRIGIPAR
jgi:hypothetical protein